MGSGSDLARAYLNAGGDLAGVEIGVTWALALAPDAPIGEQQRLKELKVIGANEKIGKVVFDENTYWLMQRVDESLVDIQVDWGAYMMNNPILTGKVGDVIILIGYHLKNNEKKEISKEISMVIQNGDGFMIYGMNQPNVIILKRSKKTFFM